MCNVQRAEGAPGPGTGACRTLFGPVDHAELSRELHVRLREMEDESRRRWDFDFQRGVPLPSSRYVWEAGGEDTVPRFYRTPRAPTAAEVPALSPGVPATPDCAPHRARAHKREQITDFFPVRKKTKVVATLCDKLHPASPIPTEHTPRKMIR